MAMFLCKDVRNLITAFITYVRPMLEYCSPVWSPVSVSLINRLESVKRCFTKRLPESLPYDDRCARLGIDRLELRRLRADLILCYKIIHGLVLLPRDDFVIIPMVLHADTISNCTCQSLVSLVGNVFFAVRVISVGNSLPDDHIAFCHLKHTNFSQFIPAKALPFCSRFHGTLI